jgi:hypothetical protein
MKYATVEDVIVSFPHPSLPAVQGELDYQTIHAIRKLLQANSRAIDTHLGGGTLGHLGLIVSYVSYAMVSSATDAGPTLWVSPTAPGRDPDNTDGTAALISSTYLGGGSSNLQHIQFRAASIEKANHQCF